MLRWIALAGIGALFVLNLLLPQTMIGRRGNDATLRADVPGAVPMQGELFPALEFENLAGAPVALADFRGHPAIITFERSVDW